MKVLFDVVFNPAVLGSSASFLRLSEALKGVPSVKSYLEVVSFLENDIEVLVFLPI